jgi:radical SAM superfamily enzyme YgiQ (UPF0313 family)
MNKYIRKVVLVNPYYQERTKSIAQITVGPPLGLAYIAALLEQFGYEVNIVDANAEQLSQQEVVRRIMNIGADLVGLSAVTPTIYTCGHIADLIKKQNENILTVIGGVHATVLSETILRECPAFDFLVKGEGEFVLVELLSALNGERLLENVRGIGYRRGTSIVINEGQGIIDELDKLPFPARHLLKSKLYRTFDSDKMTSMIAMRGCPANCIYCAVSLIAGKKCRRRNPSKIVEEINLCIFEYGVQFVAFLDDTFTFDKIWTHSLCDKFIRNGIHRRIRWSCLTRVDNVDTPLLKHLKEAGCVRVEFGIESGSQALLDYLKKGITISQIKGAFAQAKKIGLSTMGFVMLNIPGETKETIAETKKLVLEVEPDFLQISFTTPYPGTELFERCTREDLLITKDWSQYIFLNRQVIKNENITEEEFQKLIWDIEHSFHLRPGYLFFILLYILKNPTSIKTMLWAGANALKKLIFRK